MDPETENSQTGEALSLNDPEIITPINKETVHQICSGQVVLSLAIAVKELVENAIDAGATSIEVRLRDYGSELLEVGDNGNGVKKENFQALTLKHYTSKLREFHDLESIGTLGFRGEALSSLCALSELTIITRHASAEHAAKIKYDSNGKIVTITPAARDVGTTVTLGNLFATLPVRRKEFTKNVKREYGKMCQLLYAYCLVSKKIKFTCTNTTKAGSRSTVVVTEGSQSVRENIISIFGAKQVASLIEVEMIDPDPQILEEYKLKTVPGESCPFIFELLISSAVHGCGRSTSDRQFFYINSRPCEPHKVMKLINEIYKQFNTSQYPFVYINVNIQRCLVDVNVTPDKRQIFLEKEKLLLAVLKSSLLEAFKGCPSTYKVQNLDASRSICEVADLSKQIGRGTKRTWPNLNSKSEPDVKVKDGSLVDLFKKRSKSDTSASVIAPTNKRQLTLVDNKLFNVTIESPINKPGSPTIEESETPERNLDKFITLACKLEEQTKAELLVDSNDIDLSQSQQNELNFLTSQDTVISEDDIKAEISGTSLGFDEEKAELENVKMELSDCKLQPEKPLRKKITIRSSLDYIKQSLNSCQQQNKDEETFRVRFRSQINPASNQSAEQELQRQITKDMFKKMQIIGQFNLGFIITRFENDLFIIDQHATDEKYNFEQLQISTVLENQVLVNPKPLDLTAGNEELLIENEDVFRKNGFSFNIDHNAPATRKVSLTAIPVSKSYLFGKDDIDEMLFMLQENVNRSVCRPSRIRTMFASRACRKSVMVGCPLTQADMRRLVDHMGEIEQPWNCPHGRPTMRHLINLKLVEK